MSRTARHSRNAPAPGVAQHARHLGHRSASPGSFVRGLRVCLTVAAAAGVVVPIAAAPAASAATVTVKAGDTVNAIAARTGTSASALATTNHIANPNRLIVGRVLTVPGAAGAPTPAPAPATRWTVTSGDTLASIAAHTQTTVAALVKANALTNPNRLIIGQVLTTASSTASGPPGARTPLAGPSAVVHDAVATTPTGSDATAAPNPSTASPSTANPGISSSFAGRTYASSVTAAANADAAALKAATVPSKSAMQELVATTAASMGVDPALAQAIAYQESGFNMRAVSPADAIGVMQVVPSSGTWASTMVGRTLDLRDPVDNVVAGVAILRSLVKSAPDVPTSIAGYYQGLAGVLANGMYADTQRYVASVQSLMTRYA